MGFTVRFMLGTVLVLLCCWSIQTAHLRRPIRQVESNGDGKSTDKLQKIEVERTTQPGNLSEESSKPKTDFSTEDNKTLDKQNSVVSKLQKAESFKKSGQSESKNPARSIDIEKFVSKEFHNKNNVYKLPVSPDTEKFIDPDYDFQATTAKQHDHVAEFSFESELTTPKSSIFDHKYKEAVKSVDQELEHIDDSHELALESQSKENLNLKEMYEETQKNDTDANLDYINYKNIISNDTAGKNSLHKDLVVEAGTNLNFRSSYNDTVVIDEDDSGNNTIAKEPVKEGKVEASTISNLIPVKGELERAESATVKTTLLTTRKSIVLTKPPSNRNSSHISILSNNIETETVKAILPTTEKPKGDKESVAEVYTRRIPIDITKRGSIKVAHSTTESSNTISKKSEQLLQENQIVPIHVAPPNTSEVPSTQKVDQTTVTTPVAPSSTSEASSTQNVEQTTVTTPKIETLTTTEYLATTHSMTTPASEANPEAELEATVSSIETTTQTTPSIRTRTEKTVSIRIGTEPTETVVPTELETTTTEVVPTETETDRLATEQPKIETSSVKNETTGAHNLATEPPKIETTITVETETPTTEEPKIETTKVVFSAKYERETTTVVPEIETTQMREEETTTVATTFLADSTVMTTEEVATTEGVTTTVEDVTTTESVPTTETPQSTNPESDYVKKMTITTENVVRTSKGMVFGDDTTTTERVVTVTPEPSTTQYVTTEVVTTETPTVTTEIAVTETVTNYENIPIKIEEPEATTAALVTPNHRAISLPVSKYNEQNDSTTEAELITDNNTITSDSYELNTDSPDENGGTIAAITISSIGAVCLILLAGLLVIMRKRQKRFNYGQRCTPVSLDDYSMDNISVYNSVRRKGMMRGSKRSYGNPAFEDPASVSHPLNFPALGKFANNLEDMRAEFEEIPQITARTNELPEGCDTKNRYANVIPLPETRVFLSLIDGYPNSDYINANYVTGPKNTKGYYIACQAPMQNTVDDFWRMIWEQQSKVVLMLTHLFENGVEKCVDYLPPSEVLDCHRLFGDFQVTLKKREVKDKYIISIVQLKNMVSNSWREVTHFWYLGWPEKGVPLEANSLIAFLIEARSYMKSASIDRKEVTNGNLTNGMTKNEVNPVVVHCSPGTGRTGVVIACDIAIREFEQTRLVDVPRIVYKIRRDRASAVQTREQYAFIYKVINLYATKLTGGALDSL